jgi:transposase-like protein
MVDKTPPPNRDKIVLEYLNGGVTYRQLQQKYGIDHALIHYWVQRHKGIIRDRSKEYAKGKSTITSSTPEPTKPPPPPPPPLVDKEKVQLAEELRKARLKITLLEEVLRVAQDEQGLELPKKFTTGQSGQSRRTSR